MPDREIRTGFWSSALLWLPAIILSAALLAALSYPLWVGPVSADGPNSDRRNKPKPWRPNPMHKYQYEAVVRYPRPEIQWHNEDRAKFLASKGVPPEQRSFERCRAGAKAYLKDWWQHHCAKRLNVDESVDLWTLANRMWVRVRYEKGKICGPARLLGLDLDEIRGPLPEEAVAKQKQLQASLFGAALDDPDHVRRLFLMVLITPHTVETLEKLANWLDGVEDRPFTELSATRPSLKAELWRYLISDSEPRATELLRERCVSRDMEEEVYLLLFSYRSEAASRSDKDLEQMLRRAPTQKALECALRCVDGYDSCLRPRDIGYVADMACDVKLPLSRRLIVARMIPEMDGNHELCKRILRLPPGPESDQLKTALLKGGMEPGSRTVPAYLARECAISRKESDAVRTMAMRLLRWDLTWWQDGYRKTGDEGQNGKRQMMLRNIAALQAVAESPDEKPELRKLAASGVIKPLTRIEYLEARLEDQLAGHYGRELAVRALKRMETRNLTSTQKATILREGRSDLYDWDVQIVEGTLELLYAKLKHFAEQHGGKLPASLKEVDPVRRLCGLPYHYLPVKEVRDLSASTILLAAPMALAFDERFEVLGIDAHGKPSRATRARYQQFVKETAKGRRPGARLGSRYKEPTVYVMMGDGKGRGLEQSDFRGIVQRNNEARKSVGAAEIPVEAFERLLRGETLPASPSTKDTK